jgi:hypothetical protein
MPQINWKRGFFRVWLALSLAWISLILFAVAPPTQDGKILWTEPETFTVKLGTEDITYKTTDTDAAIKADLQRRIDQHNAEIDAREKNHKLSAEEFLNDAEAKWSMSEWQVIRETPVHTVANELAMLCGPPALLFVIGAVFIWIARGFSGTKGKVSG